MRIGPAYLAPVLVIILVAAAVVIALPDRFFPFGGIDQWIYFGLAGDWWSVPIDNYKESRLGWLLPLAVVEALFPFEIGNTLLQIVCLAIAGLSVFGTIWRMGGRRVPALFVGLVVVLAAPLHAVGGALYHNTLALPLTGAVALLLIVAVQRDSRSAWVVFGAAGALMVHANLLTALLVVYLWPVYLLLRRSPPTARKITGATRFVAGVAGAVALTAMLGAISMLAGQGFMFWVAGIRTALDPVLPVEAALGPFDLTYWGETWPYLWLPAVAFVGACVYVAGVVARRRLPASSPAAFIVGFFALGLAWILLQASGRPALAPDFFAIQLQIPAAIAVGALLVSADLMPFAREAAAPVSSAATRISWSLTAFFFVASLLALAMMAWWLNPLANPDSPIGQTPKYLLIACAGLACGLCAWLPPGAASRWGIVPATMLALLVVLIPGDPRGEFTPAYSAWGCRGTAVSFATSVHQAREVVIDAAGSDLGGASTVLVSQGDFILKPRGPAREMVIQSDLAAYLVRGDDRALRCASGEGWALPAALFQSIATSRSLRFFPVAGPGDLAKAPEWAPSSPVPELSTRPVVLVASTRRDLLAMERALPGGAEGSRPDPRRTEIRLPPWTIFISVVQ